MSKPEEILVERGSGNIYADLGLPDAEMMLAKAELTAAIGGTLKHRCLAQNEAAKITGISQAEISQILNGRFRHYSKDRLDQFLTRLQSGL